MFLFFSTYRHVGHGDAVIHINGHLRFLDRIEIGAVDRKEPATRGETPQRFDLHDSRIFGVAEGILGQHAFGIVDRHRQLSHRARTRRARTGAQKPRTGCVAAIDQTGQLVQKC